MVLERLSGSTLEAQSAHRPQHALASAESRFVEIHSPTGVDLSGDSEYAAQAALWGIEVSRE